jgi:hypothetical protein
MSGPARPRPGTEGTDLPAGRVSWARRWLRRFALGSGPLKRRSDRIQVLGRVLVALSVVLAPCVAVAVGTAATGHYDAVAAAQRAERSETTAVLLEDAPPLTAETYDASDATAPTVVARARWTARDGSSHEGLVPVAPHAAVASTVDIGVDGTGDRTRPPLDHDRAGATAAAIGAVALFGLPVLAGILYALLCAALDAVRQRGWARAWATVEPEWNPPSI